MAEQIKANYGKISAEVALAQITPVETSGTNRMTPPPPSSRLLTPPPDSSTSLLDVAYYDLTNLLVYIAFAPPLNVSFSPNAYDTQFTVFDARALFAQQRPQ